MRNEKTQSGERNMLHTLFTIFIFFFPFSLLHSLSSSLLSLLHNLLEKQKEEKKKKSKEKEITLEKLKWGNETFLGQRRPTYLLSVSSPWHRNGILLYPTSDTKRDILPQRRPRSRCKLWA